MRKKEIVEIVWRSWPEEAPTQEFEPYILVLKSGIVTFGIFSLVSDVPRFTLNGFDLTGSVALWTEIVKPKDKDQSIFASEKEHDRQD